MEHIEDIYEYSKNHWVSCKDYMPEDVLGWIVDDKYNKPEQYNDDGKVNAEGNQIWKTRPHHDLHYLTPKVLVNRYGNISVDIRRKFDSLSTFIWNDLECCVDDYNFYWMQVPLLTIEQQQEQANNLKNLSNYNDCAKIQKEFYKTLKTRTDE